MRRTIRKPDLWTRCGWATCGVSALAVVGALLLTAAPARAEHEVHEAVADHIGRVAASHFLLVGDLLFRHHAPVVVHYGPERHYGHGHRHHAGCGHAYDRGYRHGRHDGHHYKHHHYKHHYKPKHYKSKHYKSKHHGRHGGRHHARGHRGYDDGPRYAHRGRGEGRRGGGRH